MNSKNPLVRDLPISIPRTEDVQQFYQEPLSFLATVRSKLGDMVVLRDGGPIFSRAEDCVGALAVFGAANHRAVLSDIDAFGLPVSAAEHLALPSTLINLNRGLHSMRGEQHANQQRLLLSVLSERSIEAQHDSVVAALRGLSIESGQTIPLLASMRQLALHLSTQLLFGSAYNERAALASLLHSYFQLRREETSQLSSMTESARAELISLGSAADGALRRYLEWVGTPAANSSDGLLTMLCKAAGNSMSDDELVAHCNVLFMSCNEPIAVSLTWILLVLSQLPQVRRDLRGELNQTVSDLEPARFSHLYLLQAVINETLRLLTPNALMSRVTTKPVTLNGIELPAHSELVLCPFLAHREARRFPQPDEFRPERWQDLKPSPFEYFPFGAGGHGCVGQRLAMYVLKATLVWLIRRFDLVLAGDQEVDWRIHIMLMPSAEIEIRVDECNRTTSAPGKLLGPVAELVRLDHVVS
jgi:cytochrome P450